MLQVAIGVDVGTASVRAGVVDCVSGAILSSCVRPISVFTDGGEDYYEQSSVEVWTAVCACVSQALGELGDGAAERVTAIGFAATCSLVILTDDAPTNARDIIMWLDHRAVAEAAEVNARASSTALSQVGGRISPEMEPPKLLWLKRHQPELFARATHFMDLADLLTFRATGSLARSVCTTTCKWLRGRDGWSDAFWTDIGLGEFVEEGYRRIGVEVLPVGACVGDGLSARAAEELGLRVGMPVASGMIDAHAGGVGTLGASLGNLQVPLEQRLALICGTSSCHMMSTAERTPVPGVWGPYHGAMLPGLWLLEGGQSATGALLEHVVRDSPVYSILAEQGNVFEQLNERLAELAAERGVGDLALLTADVHVCPDFHGNRSPLADPTLRGSICGLKLHEASFEAQRDALCVRYLATVQALAYGTRHIITAIAERGVQCSVIIACGGLTNNAVFMQSHADAVGVPVGMSREEHSVVLGAACLATSAASNEPLPAVMQRMNHVARTYTPSASVRAFHDKKFKVFQRLYEDQQAYAAIMKES